MASYLPQVVARTIKQLDNEKAPGFDLIDKKVLVEVPPKAIIFLTTLFNSIIRIKHFPVLWKVSKVIMNHKPGKPPHEVSSYRLKSFISIASKLLEKFCCDGCHRP